MICLKINLMKPDLLEGIQISAEHQASFFRVLGNPQRVLILWLLVEKERTIPEIALAIGASSQTTSHHLHILGFSSLVESKREYNNIYYHLVDNELTQNCLVFKNRPKEMSMRVNPI